MKSIITIICLVACIFANKLSAREYVYVNPFSSHNQLVINTDLKLVSLDNHISYKADFCPIESSFYCINSKTFSFAVPKYFSKVDNSNWISSGVHYELISMDRTDFLGKQYEVAIIHSRQDEEKIQYVYSKKQGLLLMTFTSNGLTGMLILKGDCGIGASALECNSESDTHLKKK